MLYIATALHSANASCFKIRKAIEGICFTGMLRRAVSEIEKEAKEGASLD